MTYTDPTLKHCPGCGAELSAGHSCLYTRMWTLPAQVIVAAHLTELAQP